MEETDMSNEQETKKTNEAVELDESQLDEISGGAYPIGSCKSQCSYRSNKGDLEFVERTSGDKLTDADPNLKK